MSRRDFKTVTMLTRTSKRYLGLTLVHLVPFTSSPRIPLRFLSMSKSKAKKHSTPPEETLLLPKPPTLLPIVDTHTHVAATFEHYRRRYKQGKYKNVFEFIEAMYNGRNVESLVDVWCEAPVQKIWKEFADAALDENAKDNKWKGIAYWFALGVHPHDAKHYNDDVEKDILEAMKHPRCVALGEIGLDYHYDNSPRDIQRSVFVRQLRHAVRLAKPLTIHTREAEDDTEQILKKEVPKDCRIHIHCFSDTPEFAQRLLDHFPNLYIGITGVATYSSNLNTVAVIRKMISPSNKSPALRILLETDAPYMVPANLYEDLNSVKAKKLPLCHSAMIPWTAKFVADVANETLLAEGNKSSEWDADRVMKVATENAKHMYGI